MNGNDPAKENDFFGKSFRTTHFFNMLRIAEREESQKCLQTKK